jgi:hypothetical protein
MNAELIRSLCQVTGIRDQERVEKDMHIQYLLRSVASHSYLSTKLVFKGGTCLVKAHTPFYRFSEDIDFGWTDNTLWRDKSKRRVEDDCLAVIKVILEEMATIGEEDGLIFNPSISATQDVFIGNTGTKVTIYFNYASSVTSAAGTIKMEVNLVDLILHPPVKMPLKPVISEPSKETKFTFKEDVERYLQPAVLFCYPPQELLIEKCRAAMTRGQYKIRDTLDIVMLKHYCHLDIFDFEDEIKEKVGFTVNRLDRYHFNFNQSSLPVDRATLERDMVLLIIPKPPDLIEGMIEVNSHINALKDEISRDLGGTF